MEVKKVGGPKLMINSPGRTIFAFFVFICVTTLFVLTLDLGRVARMVPLKVVVPTMLFVVLQMLFELVPGLAQKFSRFEKLRFVKSEQIRERTLISSGAAVMENSRAKRELRMFAWILSLPVLIYIVGLLTAIPIFIFFYLRWNSKESLRFSLLMTAGTWIFIYGVFVLTLKVNLYEGLLWNWIGF